MIGIYSDNFLDYLEDRLGVTPKVTSKNIIVSCPWCEYKEEKDHYHLYIGLDIPIFNCFGPNCGHHGFIGKFLSMIEGHDISKNFVNQDTLNKASQTRKEFKGDEKIRKLNLPKINNSSFPNKQLYIQKRLKFANINIKNIKGLILDIHEFLNINNIPIDDKLRKLRDYLHNNFIGFATEKHSMVVFRNIDSSHSMKHYKLFLQKTNFLDYYKLFGNKRNSNKIVLAEGIFDIYTEQIFDFINIKKDVSMYASVHSSKYLSLIKSIVFNEQIFRPDVIILSDNNIKEKQYRDMKKYNPHLFNSLTVYYNKYGKDFNDTPVIPERVYLEGEYK